MLTPRSRVTPDRGTALTAPDELISRDQMLTLLRRHGIHGLSIEKMFIYQRNGVLPRPAEHTDDGPRWSKAAIIAAVPGLRTA